MSVTPGPEFTETGGWGSHQPALRALARFIDVRSVIEFGGGMFSTRLFLDRTVFTLLESLVTFEHSEEWATEIKTNDPRHTVICAPQGEFADKSAEMRVDFVFVDSVGDRIKLVHHGLTLAPIVAVHDYQESELTDQGFKYVRGFNDKIQTVFVSNDIDLSEMAL